MEEVCVCVFMCVYHLIRLLCSLAQCNCVSRVAGWAGRKYLCVKVTSEKG